MSDRQHDGDSMAFVGDRGLPTDADLAKACDCRGGSPGNICDKHKAQMMALPIEKRADFYQRLVKKMYGL